MGGFPPPPSHLGGQHALLEEGRRHHPDQGEQVKSKPGIAALFHRSRAHRDTAGRALVLVALVVAALYAVPAATASAAESPPPYFKSFGADGTESTGFEFAPGIAVDQETHMVYVLDPYAGGSDGGSLYKFDTEGHPVAFGGSAPNISGNAITGLSVYGSFGTMQVAVDPISHDVYVTGENSVEAFHADGEPAQFTAGPGAGTNSIGGFGELLGVAVDASGDIYASDHSSGVTVYAHSGEQIAQFSASGAGNLAVDTNGEVYVLIFGQLYKYTPSDYPVTASTTYAPASQPLDPNSALTVAVDPATNDVYVGEWYPQSEIAWYDRTGALIATFAGVEEEGELNYPEGLAINSEDQKVFVSNARETGLSQVEIFWLPPGPPEVEAVSTADVTADSTTLRARINPHRAETTYRFEYGLEDCSVSACTSVPAGGASIGAGHNGVSVSQDLTGLQANTTYHYRVFAKNVHSDNLAEEGDHTFTTQTSGLRFQLADHRAWEMVSPPDKHGALLLGSFDAHVQAAADGNGLVYVSAAPIEADPEGSRDKASVLARRIGDDWRSKDIALPNEQVSGVALGFQGEYKLFSRDLSRGAVEQRSDTPLSPEAFEQTPYVRENTEPPTFTPLLTEGNVAPGTRLLGAGITIQGASPDLSHIILRAGVPLLEEAPPAPARSLYLWTGGQLQPISVYPAVEGGTMVNTGSVVGSGAGSSHHAISDDASRVFWSAGELSQLGNSITALYLRDAVGEETVRLDVAKSVPSGPGQARPTFQGANAQGTVAFFADSQQLTEDASPSGEDLYRCEIPAASPAGGCSSLVDITAPMAGSGESAEVQGIAPGMSDDGSTIYFVARAVLDSSANEADETATSGKPNLYLWREGEGVRFIATLSEEDGNDWGRVGLHSNVSSASSLSAAASPSGRYLSFMSQRSLTGKDNLDAVSGKRVEHVFRYDASADRLECLSCNPTGAAPHGEVAQKDALFLVNPRNQWGGQAVAATLPEPTILTTGGEGVSLYSPRAVLDNGRVFFNAIDSLVPADSNGQWDVYQYEPFGVEDCSASSGGASISRSAGGCVSLISSGTGEEEAGFIDASESGDDVFFFTPARLSVNDDDRELDVYDARVDGVPATLAPATECLGEACQPIPQSPNDPTPASAAFEGPGNVKSSAHKRCARGKRQVRRNGKARCVARKHRRHHSRARHDRRAHR
jgi:hypothetical protein